MSEFADYALAEVVEEEYQRDLYASGHMTTREAFDRGYLDPTGIEQEGITEAWERTSAFTMADIDNQLSHATKDFDLALRPEAIVNLAKSSPTCSYCREPMRAREGRYGKFYFCKCPEQVTVSDTYWQKVRNK